MNRWEMGGNCFIPELEFLLERRCSFVSVDRVVDIAEPYAIGRRFRTVML